MVVIGLAWISGPGVWAQVPLSLDPPWDQPTARVGEGVVTVTGRTAARGQIEVFQAGRSLGRQQAAEDGTFEMAGIPLREGGNPLVFRVEDAQGRVTHHRRWAIADLTPPFLQLTSPLPGSVVTAPFLELRGTTEPGIRVELLLPNGQLQWQTSDPRGRFVFSQLGLQEGENMFALTAMDAVGHRRTAVITVSLAPVPPRGPRPALPRVRILFPRNHARLAPAPTDIVVESSRGAEVEIQANDEQLAHLPAEDPETASMADQLRYTLAETRLPLGPNILEARALSPLYRKPAIHQREVYVPGYAYSLKVTAKPQILPADGQSESWILVDVRDRRGEPVEDGTMVMIYLLKDKPFSRRDLSRRRGFATYTSSGVARRLIRAERKPGEAVVVARVGHIAESTTVYFATPTSK